MEGVELLDRPQIIMLSGKPASGKTVAIKAIMRSLCDGAQRPQFGRVYCSTAMLSGSYTFFAYKGAGASPLYSST